MGEDPNCVTTLSLLYAVLVTLLFIVFIIRVIRFVVSIIKILQIQSDRLPAVMKKPAKTLVC